MCWNIVVEQDKEGTAVQIAKDAEVIKVTPEVLPKDVLQRYAALTLLPTKHGIRATTEIEDVGVVHTYPNRTRYRIPVSEEEAQRIKEKTCT
jgi:hypothetical protein